MINNIIQVSLSNLNNPTLQATCLIAEVKQHQARLGMDG